MTGAIKRSQPSVAAVTTLGWLLLLAGATTLLGFYNLSRLKTDFEIEARTIHRIISQRVDQHDAHLTSLAAVVDDRDEVSPALRPIAESVLRFYPRITAIDVVAFQPRPRVTFTTRETGPRSTDPSAIAMIAATLQPGQTVVQPERSAAEYALVKRVRTGAVVMMVDGNRLSESDGVLSSGTALMLKAPGGQPIARAAEVADASGLLPVFSFEKELGSRSQPLGLLVERRPTVAELLPTAGLMLAIGSASIAALLIWFLLRERRATREASGRAAFHAQDARFARAARVNTVGEMASGIVHELTQPLAAILSQSQAGLRMAPDLKTPVEIIGVLEANARGAKRAGDILARLREYIANRAPEPEPTALNGLVRHVIALAKADLDHRGITLMIEFEASEPLSLVDRVSIEQVVHNLLLNAMEAVEGLPSPRRRIYIKTSVRADAAFIAVRDTGDGIQAENLPRLFEPFFTTKRGGMGLGLPICERLVESFGGEIVAATDPEGGAIFTVRLPLLDRMRA